MARGILIAAMDFTGVAKSGLTTDKIRNTLRSARISRMPVEFQDVHPSSGLRGTMGDFGDHFPGEKPH